MPGIKGEFIPDPPLAQSNYHHEAMGSSQRNQPVTPENLHKPEHEFLSDAQLAERIEEEVATVREEFGKLGTKDEADGNIGHTEIVRLVRDEFLFPNLRYLSAIGRLPEGVDIGEFEKEFVLPEESS